jgi:CubicO group peptidase (beta-lactamase class C family)
MYTVLSSLPLSLLGPEIPFARYVKQHIFDPLGMSSTTYSYDVSNSTGQLADGMTRQDANISKNPPELGTVRAFPFWSTAGGEDGNREPDYWQPPSIYILI